MTTASPRRPRPLVLIVMDGWGINPRKEANAIALARTPNIDKIAREWPHTAVKTSGAAVGLQADGAAGLTQWARGQNGANKIDPHFNPVARAGDDGVAQFRDVFPATSQVPANHGAEPLNPLFPALGPAPRAPARRLPARHAAPRPRHPHGPHPPSGAGGAGPQPAPASAQQHPGPDAPQLPRRD